MYIESNTRNNSDGGGGVLAMLNRGAVYREAVHTYLERGLQPIHHPCGCATTEDKSFFFFFFANCEVLRLKLTEKTIGRIHTYIILLLYIVLTTNMQCIIYKRNINYYVAVVGTRTNAKGCYGVGRFWFTHKYQKSNLFAHESITRTIFLRFGLK